jgi:hypothetical protein
MDGSSTQVLTDSMKREREWLHVFGRWIAKFF